MSYQTHSLLFRGNIFGGYLMLLPFRTLIHQKCPLKHCQQSGKHWSRGKTCSEHWSITISRWFYCANDPISRASKCQAMPTNQYKELTTSEKIRKRRTKHNLLLTVGLLQTQKYFSVSGTHDAVLMVVVDLHNEDNIPAPLVIAPLHSLSLS